MVPHFYPGRRERWLLYDMGCPHKHAGPYATASGLMRKDSTLALSRKGGFGYVFLIALFNGDRWR